MNNVQSRLIVAETSATSLWDRPAGRILVYSLMLLFCLACWYGVIAAAWRLAH